MIKRVLLIGNEKSFMANAVAKGLEHENYEVIHAEPSQTAVVAVADKPSVYLLYLGDHVADRTELLQYLDEAVDTERFFLYLIGTPEEFEKAYKVLPKNKITDEFVRPLDIKMVAKELDAAVLSSEMGEEGKKKILVVDDDGTMLRMIRTWLSVKYQVYMASSGKIALSFLAENQVDLILLDYEMPVMNGPEVFRALRENPETMDIPVMFLTARNDKDSVITAASLGPEKYLLKTMPKAKLIGSIDGFFVGQSLKK
ncbi:MAG: response regulator [Butyrivibrio sp.]|jgi:CheY-like chemotaxis protein|nr:response regulator [Butyrivibrio sp.]